MATKDWKKIHSNKIHTIWKNEKTNIYLDLFHEEKEIEITGGIRRILRQYKSKSQALKFAKSYMRRH